MPTARGMLVLKVVVNGPTTQMMVANIARKIITTMVGTDQKVADHATNAAEVRTMAAPMMMMTTMPVAMNDVGAKVADLTEGATA